MNNRLKFVFIGLIVFAVALSFYLRQSADDAIGAANIFITNVQDNELSEAYAQLSSAMQIIASSDELTSFVQRNQLNSATWQEWTSLSKNAAREVLTTRVTTSESVEKPLVAVFSNAEKDWYLDALLFPQDASADKLKSVTPDMLQMRQLVGDSVQDFATSLKNGNMQYFHAAISKLWRDQATPEQLQQAFQGFFDAGLDLTVLSDVIPVIDDIPQQDDKGVITVSGFFPTRPSKMSFEQRFIWEGLNWKLVGFTANIN